MSSVQDWIDCPQCQSQETFVTDFNCRTGEESGFCTKCGYSQNAFLKRDDNGNLVREKAETFDLTKGDIVYERVQKNYDTKEIQILHRMPVSPNDTEQDIMDFINMKLSNKYPEKFADFKDKAATDENWYVLDFISHIEDVSCPTSSSKQLWHNLTELIIKDGVLEVWEPIWECKEENGHGVMVIKNNGISHVYSLKEGITAESLEITDDMVFVSIVKDGKLVVLKDEE